MKGDVNLALIIQDSNNTKTLDGGKIMLTDANGKEIVVDMNDINDASTYSKTDVSNIENFNKNMVNISSKITDEDGNVIDERDLINDVKGGDVTALDVTFEATHSGRRINYALYNSESMAEDCTSFMMPFGKPLIKNHDRHEEPLGRTVNSNFDKSEFLDDSDTINVTFRVSDQDAMEKFADGRYKTMSIGASAKKIVCNTCGKTILDSGKVKFCGHWRGETYKDSVCTWSMTGLDYREGSVVNDPADEYAQVKRIKVLRKGDSKMSDATKTTDPTKTTTDSAITDVDNILGGAQDNNTQDPAKTTEPGGETKDTKTEPETTEPGTELTDAEKITKLEADLKKAQDELEAEKAANVQTLATKDSELDVIKAENQVKDSELSTKKEQLVTLAKLNKQLLTDNLMTLRPEIKDEDVVNKTATELNKMISDARVTAREKAKLTDPGAKLNDKNTIVDGEEVNDNKSKKETMNTMKDMENVVSKLLRV